MDRTSQLSALAEHALLVLAQGTESSIQREQMLRCILEREKLKLETFMNLLWQKTGLWWHHTRNDIRDPENELLIAANALSELGREAEEVDTRCKQLIQKYAKQKYNKRGKGTLLQRKNFEKAVIDIQIMHGSVLEKQRWFAFCAKLLPGTESLPKESSVYYENGMNVDMERFMVELVSDLIRSLAEDDLNKQAIWDRFLIVNRINDNCADTWLGDDKDYIYKKVANSDLNVWTNQTTDYFRKKLTLDKRSLDAWRIFFFELCHYKLHGTMTSFTHDFLAASRVRQL